VKREGGREEESKRGKIGKERDRDRQTEREREREREREAGGTFCAQNMDKRQVVLVSARPARL
jgi:hypothetical protein